ncbi:hypothetical protein GCM10010236_79430 [Streptomyces eurythermus]|nr:hypothetical protein GCM10010236_79430 [Streptomyces eurythermus]
MLGLRFMGFRTLEWLSAKRGESLLLACADGWWTRRRGGRPSVTEESGKRSSLFRRECRDRAKTSMSAKRRLVHQYVFEGFPEFPQEVVPLRPTLLGVWREWFGPGGSGSRYE